MAAALWSKVISNVINVSSCRGKVSNGSDSWQAFSCRLPKLLVGGLPYLRRAGDPVPDQLAGHAVRLHGKDDRTAVLAQPQHHQRHKGAQNENQHGHPASSGHQTGQRAGLQPCEAHQMTGMCCYWACQRAGL